MTRLLLREAFEGAHRWFGRSIVAAVIVVIAVFGNQRLASYRAVRWQSPRTIELFKQLNKQIPPDKGRKGTNRACPQINN